MVGYPEVAPMALCQVWQRMAPHLTANCRRSPGIGHLRRRREGKGAEGQGRERHRVRRGGARFPDSRQHRRGRRARTCRDPKYHKYTPDARPARATRSNRRQDGARFGLPVRASQVLVTNGGKHAVFNTFAALLDPGDEVICPRRIGRHIPRRSASPAACRSWCPPTRAPASRHDRQLERRARRARRRLLFVSPSTRAGPSTRRDEVEAIGRWALDHGVWVVTDEIYEHLVYGDNSSQRCRPSCPSSPSTASSSTAWPRPTP